MLIADESDVSFSKEVPSEKSGFGLPEKRLKQILERHLCSLSWIPQTQWKFEHGIDIEAKQGPKRWVIQVKSPNDTPLKPNIIFALALGEIIQRMDSPDSKYSIALPDSLPFYRLWRRLPQLAKQRMGLSVLLVNSSGEVKELF